MCVCTWQTEIDAVCLPLSLPDLSPDIMSFTEPKAHHLIRCRGYPGCCRGWPTFSLTHFPALGLQKCATITSFPMGAEVRLVQQTVTVSRLPCWYFSAFDRLCTSLSPFHTVVLRFVSTYNTVLSLEKIKQSSILEPIVSEWCPAAQDSA